MKFEFEDWLVLSLHCTFRSCTVTAHCCVSNNKAPWNTTWCGITNGDLPNFLLLRLRAGESFRPSSSPLKSAVTEEHESLSTESSSVLRTRFLLSLKLFYRMIDKVFWSEHTKDWDPSLAKSILSHSVCGSTHKRCPDRNRKHSNISRFLQKQCTQ